MRKKLIEVALPLEAISDASSREKSIRHGHPSTLHLYWSRKPLAAARAVIFSSIVDDPDQEGLPVAYLEAVDALPRPLNRPDWAAIGAGERRRLKLFAFIEQLVQWENSDNQQVLRTAKKLIDAATDGNPPPLWDPFAGGGSIPLEAQRLGLESRGSDLNPLAVLINKALIELPGEVAGQPPTHPESHNLKLKSWKGAQGLAEDVRWWGEWLRNEAEKSVGKLYPSVQITSKMAGDRADLKKYVGQDLTVIAWKWVRTVKCSNPVCGVQMPLTSGWYLSKKQGKESWVKPNGLWVDSNGEKHVRFEVKTKSSESGKLFQDNPTVGKSGGWCIVCGASVKLDSIRMSGKAGKLDSDLFAIICEGERERVYLSPGGLYGDKVDESSIPWLPEGELPHNPRAVAPPLYGMKRYDQLFTYRQLKTLTCFIDILRNSKEIDKRIKTYLTLAISRTIDYSSCFVSWNTHRDGLRNTFASQTLPIIWDYAEANIFSKSTGNFLSQLDWVVKVLQRLPASKGSYASQRNAGDRLEFYGMISTDPPYYDSVGYADISDYFYVWQRESLRDIYPELFATLLTPKADELVATPYRHKGNKTKAAEFFETGLASVWKNVKIVQNPSYPVTIYYAYKQTEKGSSGDVRFTGWDTILQAILDAGFMITATWPMRSERPGRTKSIGTNALASSIVLACRPRIDKRTSTRGALIEELRESLPKALGALQTSTLPPVDFPQASIGPAIAIFSQYEQVLDVTGETMTVAQVLPLILEQLAEAQQDLPNLDPESRFAMRWYDAYGWTAGPFGEAETMATAMNLAVSSLDTAGIASASGSKVQLIKAESLPRDYDPSGDNRFTLWEVVHYLGRALDVGGETAAASLLAKMQEAHPNLRTDAAKELCNALFSVADRRGRNDDALFYNQLGQLWSSIVVQSSEVQGGSSAPDLFNQ